MGSGVASTPARPTGGRPTGSARDLENRLALKRAGIISGEDEKIRDEGTRPLADHLADWRKDLMAKGKTGKHADQYSDRAGKVIAMVEGQGARRTRPGPKGGGDGACGQAAGGHAGQVPFLRL